MMLPAEGGEHRFTCISDNQAIPGPDPMCMDKNALEWVMAWIKSGAHVMVVGAEASFYDL